MNPILNIDQKYKTDESISNYETYGFYPITGTNLNNAGSVTIDVQNSDCFYHPARSWLEFEGTVESSTAADYTKDTLISLANNGIMYLFDNIKYLLSSAEVESVLHPGHASTIMGLAKYPSSYTPGLSQCWLLDSDDTPTDVNIGFKNRRALILTSEPAPLGSFRFAVPLSHIFGFCEDYDKVIYGFQHSLVLTRSSSDHDALFRRVDTTPTTDNVPDGKVKLSKLRWMLPRCRPSDVARYKLFKQIESKVVLDVGFRMRQCITTSGGDSSDFTWRLGVRSSPEQPRYIFIAFQKARHGSQQKNIAAFDDCGLTSAHILLNGDRYPLNDFDIDFKKNHFDTIYQDFASFIHKFYGLDRMVASSAVDPLLYKSIYPILMFDVSKQSERFKSGVTDITVHCQFKEALGTTTRCHAVMISDRKLRFESDGNKMVVLY